MLNERKEKVFEYYTNTYLSIASKIEKNIKKNGGRLELTHNQFKDFVCDIINSYTTKFFDLGGARQELTEDDMDSMDNVVTEKLLALGAISDLIATEKLTKFCCKEISGLMYFTSNNINQDED